MADEAPLPVEDAARNQMEEIHRRQRREMERLRRNPPLFRHDVFAPPPFLAGRNHEDMHDAGQHFRFEIQQDGMNIALRHGPPNAAPPRLPNLEPPAEPARERERPARVRNERKRKIKEEVISDVEEGPLETDTDFDFEDPATTHDRVLIIEDTRIYVESRYLSVWSEFFQTLFTNSSFKEAGEKEMQFSLLTKEEMLLFLRVIYPGSYEIRARNFATLMSIGYRLISKGLLVKCRKFYQEKFRELDKPTLLKLAFDHNIADLKKRIMRDIQRSQIDYEVNGEDPKTIMNDWVPMVKDNMKEFTPEMAKFVLKGMVL